MTNVFFLGKAENVTEMKVAPALGNLLNAAVNIHLIVTPTIVEKIRVSESMYLLAGVGHTVPMNTAPALF